MSKPLKFFTKFFLMSLLALLSLSSVSLARPPAQGPEPIFETNSHSAGSGQAYAAASGSAIYSQKTTLNGNYFAQNGTRDGLIADADGLRLSPGSSSGTFTSDPIHSPLSVTTDLVPTWRAELPPGVTFKLETRLSSDGFSWSDWAENPALSDLDNAGAFIASQSGEEAGVMVWIGSREPVYIQARLTLSTANPAQSPLLQSLSLTFSDASQGPTDAAITAQLPFESAANVCPAPEPPIVSRTQWGSPDGQNSPRWTPRQTELRHVIIAHTATPNDLSWYGVSDWAAVVRAIWNFHANTLGWGDIGYNYLVDPTGKIYEGRAGSQDGQYDIIGAHDGKNANSLGLAFIGCYGNCETIGLPNADPPQTMMNKGVELMAWKLGAKGIDPQSYNYYHNLWLPVIAGARDVYPTYSPGDILYHIWLPWLRDAVATRTECSVPVGACQISDIVFDKPEYNINDVINLTAYVKDPYGNPLGGASVTAQTSVLSASANAALVFDDHTGEYTSSFYDTNTPGLYAFTVTANHPDFGTCTRVEQVEVKNSSTPPTPTPTPTLPTPTPGPTPTPTPGPTPTPTPQPSGTTVSLSPTPLRLFECDAGQKTDLNVSNISELSAFSFKLRFDPNVVRVRDANPDMEGVQITLGDAFGSKGHFIAVNQADNAAGLVDFAVTLIGAGPLDGDLRLAEIDWEPYRAGDSNLTFDEMILVKAGGTGINTNIQNGRIEVNAGCGSGAGLSGQVQLQGRSDYSGVSVSDGQTQVQTGSDGVFAINSSGLITLNYPGYLSAQGDAQSITQAAGNGLQAASLGSITLLAGDVNSDDIVDILDLAYMANRYQSSDPTADLNADGVVNVMDLVLAANNYQQQGPLSNWQ